METIKKIVVIGPESTGKSTLCHELANFYDCLWVPEFAREYLEKKGPQYVYKDLLLIADGQLQLEEKFLALSQKKQNNKLFFDTDLNVIKVWSEFVFNQCDNRILNKIAEKKYDLYLLCDIDLEWTEDPLREYPDRKIREKLFHFYKDLMINQSTPWGTISGNYEERFKKAVAFIESSFN